MPILVPSFQQILALQKVSRVSWKQKQVNSLSYKWRSNMILNFIKIYLHNVCKNNFTINTILETKFTFDVIFIREPSWSVLRSILSFTNCKGDELVRVSNYPNWIKFSRPCMQPSDSPRVINICLSLLRFSLRNDVLQHKDISCISFFNHRSIYFLINIYSDLSQVALKYLKDTEVNINNALIMAGNFNIRDHFWNPNFPHHSFHRDILFEIVDSFQLEIFESFEFLPTRYSDNP